MDKMEYWKNTNIKCFEGEIWKDIEDFKGYYQVSTFGRLSSLRNNIILKQRLRKGYLCAKLTVDGVATHKNTHIYVAKTFIPNPENKTQINHKDCNKVNNHISNLEWATPIENMKHAYDNNLVPILFGENHYNSILKEEEIVYIFENKDNLTMNELSKKFNVSTKYIFSIWNKNTWGRVTKNLIPNNIYERGYSKEEIIYIFINPHNLLSWELAEIFECSLGNINAIQRGLTYNYHTKNMELNRQIGSKSSVFYKYFHQDKIYYVSSIQRFYKNIVKGKLGRTSIDKLAFKKENSIKGWTCEEITKENYILHLKKQYNEYIKGCKK